MFCFQVASPVEDFDSGTESDNEHSREDSSKLRELEQAKP